MLNGESKVENVVMKNYNIIHYREAAKCGGIVVKGINRRASKRGNASNAVLMAREKAQ
jgi:hypothetical protein